MANPKRDNEKAARVLIDAALTTDAQACAKHSVALRTLQSYRAALKTDQELARIHEQHAKLAAAQGWASELDITLNMGIQKLRTLIGGVDRPTAHNIEVVTTAVLGMAELAMTRDMITARLRESDPDAPGASPPAPQPHALN